MKFNFLQRLLLVVVLVSAFTLPYRSGFVSAQGGEGGPIFIPFISKTSNSLAGKTTVNAPYFPVADVVKKSFASMGIFWYGQLNSNTNYTDVRVGYNDTALYVNLMTIDKWLAYNQSSIGSDLESWDGATLLLDLGGNVQRVKPSLESFRFVAQLRHWEEGTNYQAAYRGNGSKWVAGNIPFSSQAEWRGADLNGNLIDNGWIITFVIPFSSLGISKPADGTVWRMALLTHDRDSQAGPPLADQRWPEGQDRDNPASWAYLRFGIPAYTPPEIRNVQTTVIRQGLNGATVKDTAAGGGFVCGMDNADIWSQWGYRNFGGQSQFNIQNQWDESDWPCFSKYFVTFPLSSIPAGKTIRSAKLILRLYGGSDPSQAPNSAIQMLRVGQDWDEFTLNWNNAPMVLENGPRTWVEVYRKKETEPGDPYEWDVSKFVSDAYSEKAPLRLAVYGGAWDMHSGKYFFSSDADIYLADSRPTLVVEWGNP